MASISLRVKQGSTSGQQIPVHGELTLGSKKPSDVVLADHGVSRSHARVADAGDWVELEDLGSSNGTYVNGERIHQTVEIVPGDEIQMGDAILEVGDGAANANGTAATTVLPPEDEPDTDEHEGPVTQTQELPATTALPPTTAPPPENGRSRRGGRAAPVPVVPPRGSDPTSVRPARAGRQSAAPQVRSAASPNQRQHPMEGGNLPALASSFMGPLSIFLLIFSTGAAFFIALPVAIGAVVFGNVGASKVDKGETDDYKGLATLGKITGWIGTILATLIMVIVLTVAAFLHATENSFSGLSDRIGDELGINLPGGNDDNNDGPFGINFPGGGDNNDDGSGGIQVPDSVKNAIDKAKEQLPQSLQDQLDGNGN